MQSFIIAVLAASVLPLWWRDFRIDGELRQLREAATKVDQLDEVVARLCEAAGVPTAEAKK